MNPSQWLAENAVGIVGTVGACIAIYGAIRADLAGIHARIEHHKERLDDHHDRLDRIEFGRRHTDQ